jgi:phosphohistidine phosphatase SixA
MQKVLLLAGALALLAACFFKGDSHHALDGTFRLFLIRHAEKVDSSPGADLKTVGHQRAALIADWMIEKDIEAVWSSNYKRTLETARPLANRLRIEVRIYDPRNQGALVEQLLSERLNALVVGHSNTIPSLATLLCDCVVDAMQDTEHDRTILITVQAGSVVMTELDHQATWKLGTR